MTAALRLVWKPPGSVANAFYWNRDRAAGIQGPVGSAKTSTCDLKAIRIGTEQQPSTLRTTEDGRPLRRVKCCTVHMTYRQLWRATIPTWWKWMPKEAGHWEGGKDSPAQHSIPIDLPPTKDFLEGTRLDFVNDFVAIGDNRVEDVLRGYEPTFFILNEADLLPPEIFPYIATRWGRFPPVDEGGPTWWGAFFDFNAPVIGSYLHEQITEGEDRFFTYFRQPGGMDPGAENLHNLPEGYYADQIAQAKSEGRSDIVIDRMVHNKFGQRTDGKPVYPEFNDGLHVAPQDLRPVKGLPLIAGFDAGGTPAMTLWQRQPDGQWWGLDELAVGMTETMGPSRFGDQANQLLRERYEGFQVGGWADPSAFFGGDAQGDDQAWVQIVAAKTRMRIRPAPGNNALTPRREAIRKPLGLMIDGRKPGILISPRMKVMRRGLGGGFRFRKLNLAKVERYHEEPEKNFFSHTVESGEYALLGGGDYGEIMGRERARNDGRRQTRAIDEDNPQGQYAGPRRQRRAVG